mgnify:CR=1 FL=1
MSSILFIIILVPVIEIYLFIKIGSQIGALTTILLIFVTAVVGIYYARYEGLNTLKSGFIQLNKKQMPAYEVLSGMIKNISDVNDKLMDLNKKNKDMNKQEEVKQVGNTTNNVFLGSTADLQRLLKDESNIIDVTPEPE